MSNLKKILLCWLLIWAGSLCALDLAVPEPILSELTSKELTLGSTTVRYKVVYPENYDSSKQYPVVLGLSGGGSTEKLVDYCYYKLFRSKFFNDRILLLPIAPFGKGHAFLNREQITGLLQALTAAETVNTKNWLVVGTSNGGVGAFNYARVDPQRFDGIIAMPGGVRSKIIPSEWRNYRVLLAVGEHDSESWWRLSGEAVDKLTGKVAQLLTI